LFRAATAPLQFDHQRAGLALVENALVDQTQCAGDEVTSILFQLQENRIIIVPMPDKMNDTHPSAEAVQIALLRNAGQARRSRLMLSITQSTLNLSRRAIRQQYSHLSLLEQHLKFVELVYGVDLANRLRNYLQLNRS